MLQIIFLTIFVFFLTDNSVVKGLVFGLYLLGLGGNLMVEISFFLEVFVLEAFKEFLPHLVLFECFELCELFFFDGHLILFFDVMDLIESEGLFDGLFQHFSLDNGLESVGLDFVLESIFKILFVLFFDVFEIGCEFVKSLLELFIFF